MFIPKQIAKNYYKVKELGLSINEFYTLFLLYQSSKRINGKLTEEALDAKEIYSVLVQGIREVFENNDDFKDTTVPLLPEQIDNLTKSGFITFSKTKGTVKYNLNTEKLESIFANPTTCSNEILELFADVKLRNVSTGQVFSAANIDNIKQFREDYMDAIEYSTLEHKEVIKDINYALDNNLLNTGLQKVVQNRLWTSWRKERTHNHNIVDNSNKHTHNVL